MTRRGLKKILYAPLAQLPSQAEAAAAANVDGDSGGREQ